MPRVRRAMVLSTTIGLVVSLLPVATLGVEGAGTSVGGRAWRDTNADGLQDGEEPGLAGIVVLLFGPSDGGPARIEETITGASGDYAFDGVPDGDHVIQFRLPAQLAFARMDAGDDDALDSDVDPLTGRTAPVTVSGTPIDSVDAGLLAVSDALAIGGLVWEDADDDGFRDDGEMLLPGVTIDLLREVPPRRERRRRGGRRGGGGRTTLEMQATTQTDALGAYAFSVLRGSHRYRIEVRPPNDHATVTQDQGDDSRDSDVDPANRRSDALPADADHIVDIGLAPMVAIGDWAWVDADGDGIQDPGEIGLDDVLVGLFRFDREANEFRIDGLALTDADGVFAFEPRRPGTYQLRFLPPDGWDHTLFEVASVGRALDSDALRDTGTTPDIILPGDANPGLGVLFSDIWDAGFVEGDGILTTTLPVDTRPQVCDTQRPTDDPEATMSSVRLVRGPDGERWFVVLMAGGLERDYSFALVLFIRTPMGPIAFIWELHDGATRIGQADPQTGELIRELGDGLDIFHDRASRLVAFRIPPDLIDDRADVAAIQGYFTPQAGERRRCHVFGPFDIQMSP